jgi:hypothetical protein
VLAQLSSSYACSEPAVSCRTTSTTPRSTGSATPTVRCVSVQHLKAVAALVVESGRESGRQWPHHQHQVRHHAGRLR